MTGVIRFSPLALAQLDMIWDYAYKRFGPEQADVYIDGLFDALEELQADWIFHGVIPRLVPPDLISDITSESIYFIRYEHEILYLKHLDQNQLGVVCILGDRMDTPNRLLGMLVAP